MPSLRYTTERKLHMIRDKMSSAICIGDVHGELQKLTDLLSFLPPEPIKVFVGDLIDRGPDSVGVLRLVKEMCDTADTFCVKGNHEDMMVSGLYDKGGIYHRSWLSNGGAQLNAEWETLLASERDELYQWLETLPHEITFPTIKKDDRYLVVNHAGRTEGSSATMCHRSPVGVEGIFQVFGHTPGILEMDMDKGWARIDGGAVFDKETPLMAFQYPECIWYDSEGNKGVKLWED